MFALLIVQANTGVLTGYRRDATVRSGGKQYAPKARIGGRLCSEGGWNQFEIVRFSRRLHGDLH